jgi:hypothetical protein
MKEEACDCSPEFCQTCDTSYNKHVKNSCIHIDGTSHNINKSNDKIAQSVIFLDFKETDLSKTKQHNQS